MKNLVFLIILLLTYFVGSSQIIIVNDISCNGDVDGVISVNANFGTGPYSYLWSTGETEISIDVGAGIYSVTATDVLSVSQIYSTTLTEPALLQVSLVSVTDVLCNGTSTGVIDVSVSGGSTPYNYNWSNGAISEDIVDISAGIYSLVLNDNNGCYTTFRDTVNQPISKVTATSNITDVTCFGGSNGSISLNGIGGTGTKSYAWSTGAITPTITALSSGIYVASVTDANFCTFIEKYEVTQPKFPVQVELSSENIKCSGDSTGSLSIEFVNWANGPYTYLWSNGQTSHSMSDLKAGAYGLTVTDMNNCRGTSYSTITESTALGISPIVTPSDCDGHNNGSISLNASGGVSPYSFLWKELSFDSTYTTQDLIAVRGGNYFLLITDSNDCLYLDTLLIPSLDTVLENVSVEDYICNGHRASVNINSPEAGVGNYFTYEWNTGYDTSATTFVTSDSILDHSILYRPGDYTVTLTRNADGCAAYVDFNIKESATAITVEETVIHNNCYEQSSGSISLDIFGGDPKPDYEIDWTGPNGFASTSFYIGSLRPGDYTFTVRDDSVCTLSETIQIGPFSPIQGSVEYQDVRCFGEANGKASAFFSGGTGTLNYFWSNGATNESIVGLFAGNYSLTVTDSLSCRRSESFVVAEPPIVEIVLDEIIDVSCNGYKDGSIRITTFGGNSNLDYLWLRNGQRFAQLTEDLSNIPAGMYQITAYDTLGCYEIDSFEVAEPGKTYFSDSVYTISCNNGTDGRWEIIPNGPDNPYSYFFSTGENANSYISGLSAGNYSATVTSLLGCQWEFEETFIQPLPIKTGLADVTDVICKGDTTGSLSLDTVYGGTYPYTYNWNNGMSASSISNIPAGKYNVTITDSRGCYIYESYEVSEPYEWIKYFPTISPTTCKQASNGEVVLYDIDVYNSPYFNTFYLFDSTGVLVDSVNTSQVIADLNSGKYMTRVVNEYGCFAEDSLVIPQGDDNCIKIPNIVTANADGFNDVFCVEGACHYDEFSFEVFTDRGVKVFESQDCNMIWDPNDAGIVSSSTYYYRILVIDNGESYEFRSSINILN